MLRGMAFSTWRYSLTRHARPRQFRRAAGMRCALRWRYSYTSAGITRFGTGLLRFRALA